MGFIIQHLSMAMMVESGLFILRKYGVYLYRVTSAQYSSVPGYVKEQLMDYIAPGNGICYLNRTVCPESFHDGSDYLNEVFFGVQCYDLLDQAG